MAEPRAYCTEWTVRKRKIKTVYQCIYIESRKMVLWAYLQGSNRDADIENRLTDTVREGEGGMNWE